MSSRASNHPKRMTKPDGILWRSVLLPVIRVALLGFAFLVTIASFQRNALAYTDPGTGALIWQMLAAAFVGAAFYFRRFMTWIKGKKSNPGQEASQNQDDKPAERP